MTRVFGYLVSEIVTAVIGVAILIGVAFSFFVSHQRDGMVDLAQQNLINLREELVNTKTSSQLIECDKLAVNPKLLENEYLPLALRAAPLDSSDLTKGYGVGVYVHSKKNVDSDDTFVTASRWYEAVKKEDEDSLRPVTKKKDEIEYSVLITHDPICRAPKYNQSAGTSETSNS